MASNWRKYWDVWVCLVIVGITLAVYWRVQDFDFVNIDDDLYVSENPHVQEGLTVDSVIWAFSFQGKKDTYWHPVAWLSHALDCRFFGLKAGRHHLTNLVIHVANILLLFWVFRRMTGAFWRSAFVAALFAIHPINVDTVAWVAERKNVLSTFFWMLTLLAYVYYAEKPIVYRYLLVLLMFVLGLLTKPVLVTLPFVLLLLDYWPLKRFSYERLSLDGIGVMAGTSLGRFRKFSTARLIVEKVPFFALSGLTIGLSSLSVLEQVPLSVAPMGLRIANALASYVQYIGKMFWPQGLTVLYPYPRTVPAGEVVGAVAFLGGVTLLAIWFIKRAPFLLVGWFWFLGTLVPVLGLVQVGLWPAMADRFAYVPFIGLFLVMAWGIPEITRKWPYQKTCLSVTAALLLLGLFVVTWKQVGYWKNSITLFERNLEFTSNNHIAHTNLGAALNEEGRLEEAIAHYLKALQLRPDSAEAHNNLGLVLEKQGRRVEAIKHYYQALKYAPDSVVTIKNLAVSLDKSGQSAQAIQRYLHVLRINPDAAEVHYRLGIAFNKEGRTEEAMQHYLQALRVEPDFAEAHNNLGNIFINQGRLEEAIGHYSHALRIKSDSAEAHNNLGVALIRKGMVEEGIGHIKTALRIDPDYGPARRNVGLIGDR